MLESNLLVTNLLSPAVIAFILGLLAALLRSDLRFPDAITTYLSAFLLLSIGFKGGVALREIEPSAVGLPLFATVVLGSVLALVTFAVARRLLQLPTGEASSLAAHYGSVSAVTFTASVTFVATAGYKAEGFMPALVAAMEIPGIVIGLALALRSESSSRLLAAIREAVTGKSIVLLLGGIAIGRLSTDVGVASVEPYFVILFPGLLTLFLLDMGSVTGRRLLEKNVLNKRLVAFGLIAPLVFGFLGVTVGFIVGLSVGGQAVLGAMAASASYIAAPAAVRVGLPNVSISRSIAVAVGVTFPFNLAFGIPLYLELAKVFS